MFGPQKKFGFKIQKKIKSLPTAKQGSRQRVSLPTATRTAVGEDAVFADCPTWQSAKRAGPGPAGPRGDLPTA